MKVKKLFIIRHAKAEEHTFAKKDYDRNIIEKGILRASKIAPLLKDKFHKDNRTVFISSSANRAIQTAHLFAEVLDFPIASIIQTKTIYEAHYQDILQEINKVSDHVDTVFVFGHNPGLSDLTNYLCNTYINLKTSAVAIVNLDESIDFSTLSGSTAYLQEVCSE